MGPLAALEFQYLLQLRTDQRRSKIYPSAWTRTVITFLQEGVSSVRDRPVEYWRGLSPNHSLVPSIFTTLSEALEDLDEPAEEWERLVWRPERLGFSVEERQRVAPLDFTVITQPWLREKVMRYARLRLARLELRSVARNLVSFKLFSGFLAEACPDRQDDPAVLDRRLLETFIGWLGRRTVGKKGRYYGLPISPGSRSSSLSTVSLLLETWRLYHWAPALPADARIHRDEYPRPRGLNANFIDEYLMEQIESEENLALLDPETRTLLLICRDEGLRISEVLTLNTDCLKKTPAGRWALVHYKSEGQELPGYPGLPGGRGRDPRADRSCQAAVRRCLPMAVPPGHGQSGRQVPDALRDRRQPPERLDEPHRPHRRQWCPGHRELASIPSHTRHPDGERGYLRPHHSRGPRAYLLEDAGALLPDLR